MRSPDHTPQGLTTLGLMVDLTGVHPAGVSPGHVGLQLSHPLHRIRIMKLLANIRTNLGATISTLAPPTCARRRSPRVILKSTNVPMNDRQTPSTKSGVAHQCTNTVIAPSSCNPASSQNKTLNIRRRRYRGTYSLQCARVETIETTYEY